MADIKQTLAASEMFNGCSAEGLDRIAALGRLEVYEKGAPLFVQGAAASDFYVVDMGRVVLNLNIPSGAAANREIAVEIIRKGQSCGYPAVKGMPVYDMTARAVEPVRVIAIDGAQLYDMLRKDPVMGYRIMSRMASALSDTLRNVISMLQIFRR